MLDPETYVNQAEFYAAQAQVNPMDVTQYHIVCASLAAANASLALAAIELRNGR